MNNFGDAYKKAVEKIKVPVVTANQIADEVCRKRIAAYRIRRQFAAAVAAASVFIVCSLGVAAAAGYAKSVIRATEYGFETSDEETALLNNGWKDAGCPEIEEETDLDFLSARGADSAENDTGNLCESQKQAESEKQESTEEIELEEQMFDSRDDFLEAGLMPAALPKEELISGEDFSEEYIVCGDFLLLVRVEAKDSLFMMNQTYYGDTSGHASSVVYPEGVCNEREYITGQGYVYKVVDSVCEEGEVCRIHAAISIGDYELIIDFSGYSEEEAFRILDSMDLNIYL